MSNTILVEMASREGQREIAEAFKSIKDPVIVAAGRAEIAADSAEQNAVNAQNAETGAVQAKNDASAAAATLIEYLETKETLTAPAVDPTLSISGAAADSAVTGTAVDVIKDLFSGEPLTVNIDTNGFWNTESGDYVSPVTTYNCIKKIPVNEGWKLTCNSIAGDAWFWLFWDKAGNFLNAVVKGNGIVAPANAAYFAMDFQVSAGLSSVNFTIDTYLTKKVESFEKTEETTDFLCEVLDDSYDYSDPLPITMDEGKLLYDDGSVRNYENINYRVSDFIDISDKTYVHIEASTGYEHPYFVKYDSDHNLVSAGELSPADGNGNYTGNVYVGDSHYIRISQFTSTGLGAVKDITGIKSSDKKWSGKKWVVIGDSLTAENTATTKHYFDYIADMTDIEVSNYGIGGTGYANPGDYGNFVTRMASVPTDADVYTIFGSFNDMAYMQSESLPFGTASDTGTSSLCGYINAAFDALFTRIPLANLGVIAPCPWVGISPITGNTTFGENYTNALRECCKRRSIPFLDLYHESGMRPWDPNFVAGTYTKDIHHGVHPDETGHAILAPKFMEFVKRLLLY